MPLINGKPSSDIPRTMGKLAQSPVDKFVVAMLTALDRNGILDRQDKGAMAGKNKFSNSQKKVLDKLLRAIPPEDYDLIKQKLGAGGVGK